jgi:hypothetical protein
VCPGAPQGRLEAVVRREKWQLYCAEARFFSSSAWQRRYAPLVQSFPNAKSSVAFSVAQNMRGAQTGAQARNARENMDAECRLQRSLGRARTCPCTLSTLHGGCCPGGRTLP